MPGSATSLACADATKGEKKQSREYLPRPAQPFSDPEGVDGNIHTNWLGKKRNSSNEDSTHNTLAGDQHTVAVLTQM